MILGAIANDFNTCEEADDMGLLSLLWVSFLPMQPCMKVAVAWNSRPSSSSLYGGAPTLLTICLFC